MAKKSKVLKITLISDIPMAPTKERDKFAKEIEAKGKALQQFGKLLRDDDTTLHQLSAAAFDCGIRLHFDIQSDSITLTKEVKSKSIDKVVNTPDAVLKSDIPIIA